MELYSVTTMAMMENAENVFYRKRPKKLKMRKHRPSDKSLWIRRLKLVLWKNLLLRKRHWIITILEILLPTLIAIFFAWLRTTTVDERPKLVLTDTIYPVDSEQTVILELGRLRGGIFGYVPHNNLTEMIMTEVATNFNRRKKMTLKPFDSESELEDFATKSELERLSNFRIPKVEGAIIFGKSFASGDLRKFGNEHDHENIHYTIRLASYSLKTEKQTDRIQFPGPSDDNSMIYKSNKFSGLQTVLDKILIRLLTNQSVPYDFNQQVFPYPPYKRSQGFVELTSIALPLSLIIGFVFIVPSVVLKVGSEKETGIKELMKIMGLSNHINWVGWMFNSLLALAISVTIIVFVFSYTFESAAGPVLPYGNPTVWWCVLMLYAMSATSFCFFVSVFFDQASLATAVGIVVWLLSYLVVGLPMIYAYESVTLYYKLVSCLLPNMALHWAIQIMFAFETRGVGAKWSNVFTPANFVDGLALHHIIVMFIINTFLYWTLTIYLENVLPSKYGIRKSWSYPFQLSWWVSSKTDDVKSLGLPSKSLDGFESEPSRLSCTVSVQNLSREFGSKSVLKDVTFNAYEGQITALVGHNGAGKTTLLSILTGITAPSSGTVIVGKFNVRTELEKARKSLGLCSQDNMLFDQLTVWEHLILFGRLKGLDTRDAKAEANILIAKLQLIKKRSTWSCHLSGGQKRKLSLGMALIGGPEVIILDECTSGMDPESRRLVWDLLLEIRKDRTVLISTHFMEEADVLGDRVIIMADGEVKCAGSPMFLKKHFGYSYTLKLTTIGHSETRRITNMLQSVFPNSSVTLESLTANSPNCANDTKTDKNFYELIYSISSGDKLSTNLLPQLFSELTQRQEDLGILTMNIVEPSLDEAFFKFGQKLHDESHDSQTLTLSMSEDHHAEPNQIVTTTSLLLQQLFGLFYKKLICTISNKKLLLCQLVFPPILLVCTIFIVNYTLLPGLSSPPLKLNMNLFKNSITLYAAEDPELGNIYGQLVGSSSSQIDTNKTSIVQALLGISKTHLGSYRDQYIVGAEITNTSITALHNSIPLHSAPVSLNLVSNAVLRYLSPPNKTFTLEVTNHPLQNDLFSTLEIAMTNPKFTFFVPLCLGVLVPFGLALLSASFVVFPAEERLTQFKHLQLMTGLNPLAFWGSSFLWDFFIFIIVSFVMVICVLIFESRHVLSGNNLEGIGVLIVILLTYGYSTISFSYLASLFMNSASSGFAIVAVSHIITGMIMPFITLLIDESKRTSQFMFIRYLFRLFSSYPTTLSLMRLSSISTNNTRCSILTQDDKQLICNPQYSISSTLRQCCDNCTEFASIYPDGEACLKTEPFLGSELNYPGIFDATQRTIPGIAEELQWVVIMGLVYQILIFLIESRLIQKLWIQVNAPRWLTKKEDPVDGDVEAERRRVDCMITETGGTYKDTFMVHNIKKTFGDLVPLNNLSFGVGRGECFGLLGVNGAGKSTTFRVLTGDKTLSSGNAFALQKCLRYEPLGRIDPRGLWYAPRAYMANIGYCPQVDALIGDLTGRQILQFFCNLRGFPNKDIPREVEKWLNKLGLDSVGDKPCDTYSGGTKRRLNVAIAMICDPPIVLLDEPTSGVDPVSRRQFQNVIREAKASGQCVVLTSHSMNEIQDLCSRMGIMVNGQFACIGSAEYLRNKYATGFTITWRLRDDQEPPAHSVSFLKCVMESKFQNCSLQDEHLNYLEYNLKDSSLQWNTIYQTLEEIMKMPIPSHNFMGKSSSALIDEASLIIDTKIRPISSIVGDCSVSLTSLEDVFLSFARKQRPESQLSKPESSH